MGNDDDGIRRQTTDDGGIRLRPLNGNDGDGEQRRLWGFGPPVANNGNGTAAAYNDGTGGNGSGTRRRRLSVVNGGE